jgi:predicted AAA+ superfamily ATPase
MKTYRKRVFDQILQEELEGVGAVIIEGAKWCGKTTTAEQAAKSVVYMDRAGKIEENIALARLMPDKILSGEFPRLIDEWQLAPMLWDSIRYNVDHADGPGCYILTGSSVPADDCEMRHSGAGRFSWLKMRPMSLWESNESSGEASLMALFAGEDVTGAKSASPDLEEVAFYLCRGGWPYACGLKEKAALKRAFDYLDATVKRDLSRVDGVERNEDRARRLMRSYARLQATQAAATVIKADLEANESLPISVDTVSSYINALKRLFVIEDMPAWSPNLRCKTPIRIGDTRYFVDPSIATASLGLGPDDLMNDLKTFGLVFETMAMRDLRVYMDVLSGSVFHYLDAGGLECDAVLHMRNGKYALVEIKLGGKELLEKGAATLKKLASRIDTSKMHSPAFMMILTATGDYAYRRDDGVVVCPIGALKP